MKRPEKGQLHQRFQFSPEKPVFFRKVVSSTRLATLISFEYAWPMLRLSMSMLLILVGCSPEPRPYSHAPSGGTGNEGGDGGTAESTGGGTMGGNAGESGSGDGGTVGEVGGSPSGGASPSDCDGVKLPINWEGPILVYEGDAAEAPQCAFSAFDGGTGLSSSPATCAECSCDVGTEHVCELDGTVYEGTSCNLASEMKTFSSMECTTFSIEAHTYQFDGFRVIPDCRSSGGELQAKPDPTWNGFHRACWAESCENGAANLQEGFDSVCIFRRGAHTCPGAYPTKKTIFGSYEDQRACEECSCPDSGFSCAGTLGVFEDDMCTNSDAGGWNQTASCYGFVNGGEDEAVRLKVDQMTVGTCPPTGGEPIGDVTPSEEITVCCQ